MKPVLSGAHASSALQLANAHLADVHHAITSCERCPRLRQYCRQVAETRKRAYRHEVYWGRPVPGFGDPAARLLLVGLAPAAHGANRTGRMFTGDGPGGSGDFLISALHRGGFANIPTSHSRDDGLMLHDAYIVAAARCAPPDNKPLPEEIARCHVHLTAELAALPNVRVVLALGKLGFDAYWQLVRGRTTARRPAFAHGVVAPLEEAPGHAPGQAPVKAMPTLVASYHPSRQNTNTGRLTAAMMDGVLATCRRLLDG